MKKNIKFLAGTIMTLALALAPVGLAQAQTIAPSSTVTPRYLNIAAYEDIDFYGRSQPEIAHLSIDAETISLYATCEGDEVDILTCHIEDLNGGGYHTNIPFEADGSVITCALEFPRGRYKVYFTGDADILKTEALVVFSTNSQ